MSRIVLVDFDRTLIKIDSFMYILFRQAWLLNSNVLKCLFSIIFRSIRQDETITVRSKLKKTLIRKYYELPEGKRRKYEAYLRKKINYNLVNRIISTNYDKVFIVSASEKKIIQNVLNEVLSNFCNPIIISNSEDDLDESDFITCWGRQKLKRFVEVLPTYKSCYIDIFSDSMSDAPLFSIADNVYLVRNEKCVNYERKTQE